MKISNILLCLTLFLSETFANAQNKNQYWVSCLNKSFNHEIIKQNVKDSLRSCLSDSYLPLRIQKENVNKLTYLYIFNAKIKLQAMEFTDTSSIYPYLMIDFNSLPTDVLIFKKKSYWGRLHLDTGVSFLEQKTDIDRSTKKKMNDFAQTIIKQIPDVVFYVEHFGDFIWFTHEDQIMIYRWTGKDITEADVFIHKYYKNEDIRKIAESH